MIKISEDILFVFLTWIFFTFRYFILIMNFSFIKSAMCKSHFFKYKNLMMFFLILEMSYNNRYKYSKFRAFRLV